ncbi:MAG: hypothetical protein DMG35_08250 [Acidobacteria bacterium]|nr:MAG: hypothetical protein DMG35_08250 [Acidobacteriota bacterium]
MNQPTANSSFVNNGTAPIELVAPGKQGSALPDTASPKPLAKATKRKSKSLSKTPPENRCRHYTSTGRRCRLAVLDPASGIHAFLTQLTVLLVQNRISTRRAAVLAYLTNQLLHSHRATQKEADDQPQEIIMDLPRPKRDWPEGSERAFYQRMSSPSVPNNANAPDTTNTKESP